MPLTQDLLDWYAKNRRDLPWRKTRDPYRIWLSEIMLQQTRVAAVIPYYERFLERYPDYESLAASSESELLAMWAGLGYYSRARNVQKAARMMVEQGGFPSTYEGIRALPGVGDYTAAAVASIAFGLPYVGLDGNIVRVMARVTADKGDVKNGATRARLLQAAYDHLEPKDPGGYKQSLMELGATICLPKAPVCGYCPINDYCGARLQGLVSHIPMQIGKQKPIVEEITVLWIAREDRVLLWQRPAESKRMAGFWELPEAKDLQGAQAGAILGQFSHSIVNHKYLISLYKAKLHRKVRGPYEWVSLADLAVLPVSTIVRKSLKILQA